MTWRREVSDVGKPSAPELQSHVGKLSGADPKSHVGKSSASEPQSHVGQLDADAVRALTTLGFKRSESLRAVANAREVLDDAASLEALIRAALRACPR